MSAVARDVPPAELASYQSVVRLILVHPLVTERHPFVGALALVRRWAPTLARDLDEQLGYRLELFEGGARLVRVLDQLDPEQAPRTVTGRPFDRQRYAYLCLALAVLGRWESQIAVSDLADALAAEASAIPDLSFQPTLLGHRRALVDALLWLAQHGALREADGSLSAWTANPDAADLLYDVDLGVCAALFRPARVLQHVVGVGSLLASAEEGALGRGTRRRRAALRARRALVERPVVYDALMPLDVRHALRTPQLREDLERLTGLELERRREGSALIDTSGRFSDERFPGQGTIAQVCLLLIGAIGTRLDEGEVARLAAPSPAEAEAALERRIDRALPRAGLLAELALDPAAEEGLAASAWEGDRADAAAAPDEEAEGAGEAEGERPRWPLLDDGWLRQEMERLRREYGRTWNAILRADPEGLLETAIGAMERMGLVLKVEGGVLVLPLAGRYRDSALDIQPTQARLLLSPDPRGGERV